MRMFFYAGYRERLSFEGTIYVFSCGASWFIQVLAGRLVYTPMADEKNNPFQEV
jgi:hypothetical protein